MDFKLLHATLLHHLRTHLEEITEKMVETIFTKPGTRIRWVLKLPGVPKLSLKIELDEEPTNPSFQRVDHKGPPKGPYR